jgi:hypothetical protein
MITISIGEEKCRAHAPIFWVRLQVRLQWDIIGDIIKQDIPFPSALKALGAAEDLLHYYREEEKKEVELLEG